MKNLVDYVRSIPDFPKPGILFRDITTLIENGEGFRQAIDELEAKQIYRDTFPHTFQKAFDLLMKKNGDTRETMAEKLNTTPRTLYEWLKDPARRITPDFIVTVALLWRLPDWISRMLLSRAGCCLSEYDRRAQALEEILHTWWDRGPEEANAYLAAHGLDPLRL